MKRSMAQLLVAFSFIAASCGGGSDDELVGNGSGTAETTSTAPVTTETGPEGVPIPEVSRQEIDERYLEVYSEDAMVVDECAFRPGIVIVQLNGEDLEAVQAEIGFDPNVDDFFAPLSEIDLAAFESADPLIDAQFINARTDFAASPDYLVWPMPGRMYFPGSFPEPADALEDVGAKGETPVYVIDTGHVPGIGVDVVASEDDQLALTAMDDGDQFRSVEGHGTFIASIIARNASTARVEMFAVSPSESAPIFFETNVFEAAQKARASAGDKVPMISNISLGTRTCAHTDKPKSLPLTLLKTTLDVLLPAESEGVVLAAAGNAGEDSTSTYPAAFSDPGELADSGWVMDKADVNRLANSVVAVTATQVFGTRAGWVDVSLEGCLDGHYPTGVFDYGNDESVVLDTGAATWCGSSFATALATSMVVAEVDREGVTPLAAAATLFP